MRHRTRVLITATATAAALTGPLLPGSAAPTTGSETAAGAAAAGAQVLPGARAVCPRGRGVTVVVDFGPSHKAACAPGDPASGLAALRSAGFRVAFVARVPGFVCRINGRPTPAQDACVVTPPASRYWSYWHANRGGRWVYSSKGAGSYNPRPGTVEGWSYGNGQAPTMAPPK